jgi:hypothetical protein
MFKFSRQETITAGIAGFGLLLIVVGLFLPIIDLFGETISFMNGASVEGGGPTGDGLFMLGMVIVSALLIAFKKFRWLVLPGLAVLGISFANYSDFDIFASAREDMTFFILFGGAFLLIVATGKGFMDRRSAKRETVAA